jgi:hypothetical protein
MPEPSLEGCREKHARGTAHLNRLIEVVNEYADAWPRLIASMANSSPHDASTCLPAGS